MELFISILGAVSGVISLAGVIWLVAYWKGGMDTWRRNVSHDIEQYPLGELWRMTNTMWDIYVVGQLSNRPDLADRHSPFRLKPKALELIPDNIKSILNDIPLNQSYREDVSNGWLVVKNIGQNSLEELAKDSGISVQEEIAVLSVYLQERNNRHNPGT